jgi:glycosyltransferase involved in cell wall biosynthesis
MGKVKVLMVADYPSPHLSGVFEALAAHPGLQMNFYFTKQRNPKRSWDSPPGNYPYKFLDLTHFNFLGRSLKIGISSLRQLFREDFDLVVIEDAYFQPFLYLLICCCWLKKRKWALYSEPPNRRKRSFLTLAYQKVFFNLFKNGIIFTHGRRGIEKFKKLVPASCQLVSMPYFMDLNSFTLVPRVKKAILPRSGINFLFCGRYLKLKRLDLLLQALAGLESYKWRLLLVGGGPEEKALRELVPPHLTGRVIFFGQVLLSEMPAYYGLGDVFVYPSNDDGWGMAVPEALVAGLPVISTYEASSAVDLINNGENGFLIPADSEEALRGAILYFLEHPEAISRFSQNASRVLERYNGSIISARFYEAVKGFSHRDKG